MILAGVDVGNSTTEVVLADAGVDPPRPVGWDRAPTRGRKGSVEAASGAASLVGRLTRRAGVSLTAVAAVPQRPTDTATSTLPRRPPTTGRVAVLAAGARTPGRPGVAAGRPVPVTAPPVSSGEPVVLLVPAGVGYAEAARLIEHWGPVAGVLVEADEGVLIARRLTRDVPVLDGVPVGAAASSELVALEVAEPGRPVRTLADPVRVRALLGVPAGDAQAAAGAVADAGSAALALRANRTIVHDHGEVVHDRGEGGAGGDVWVADLDAAAAEVEARRPHDRAFGRLTATLTEPDEAAVAQAHRALGDALDVPVLLAAGEAEAARAGALTTPGAGTDALVLDLGGGTIDAVGPGGAQAVVAGAGEAVTAAVAAVLGIPRGAADWVKRGPASRLEGPHLLLGEDGSRTFAPSRARGAEGCLVVEGPAGLLPFSAELAPSEWRALRLHLKRVVLGDNVSRCLARLGPAPSEILLVGGVAGDEEVLRVLDRAAPGALVGRADVAGGVTPGALGHRWAVAYGAVLLTR